MGFLKGDSKRIPGIDILLEDNQIWKAENFEAKIMHIPGQHQALFVLIFLKKNLFLLEIHFSHLAVEEYLKALMKKCLIFEQN
ncbi:MAG: hypothetical protein CM1200mP13_08210 [Candidatus Pelagibacterales bacterium]|nr:MAG: hypothetical protein CM1200mP13_08210 [Pelagibacterales bacterium]